jgi:ketosteroid isomerase-like protein
MTSGAAEPGPVVVRAFMNATGAAGRAERASLLHRDFVVRPAGGLPFSREYHGPQGFFELLTTMNQRLQLTPGPIAVHSLSDDTVVARFRLTFISRRSGDRVEMDLVEIYTVRDGLIVELDVFYKDPSAVAALLGEWHADSRVQISDSRADGCRQR